MTDKADETTVTAEELVAVESLIVALTKRRTQLGGLAPIPRAEVEGFALSFLMTHVILTGQELANHYKPLGLMQVASSYAALWNRFSGRVKALIPVKEEMDERLN